MDLDQRLMKMIMIMVCALLGVTQRSMSWQHNYEEALSKSILFFEGQRSGKLPPTQRMTWRKDSAFEDGFQLDDDRFFDKVDLIGGYYDAGDNVKFNFPMAFSTTMLAWSVIEFGKFMGQDLNHALDAIGWATDYLLKSTNIPGVVFAQVGDPHGDHNCWERPEDMDTPRTTFFVSRENPGSEVSAEIAAALAASSIVFRKYHNVEYSQNLLQRATMAFDFADKYRGSYNDSLGSYVCPFYCDYSGYQDELVWGAAWLLKATNLPNYWNYIKQNIHNVKNFGEFGWDSKDAGINVLVSKLLVNNPASMPFTLNADKFICAVLPESPLISVSYSRGGLLFKSGGSNMQHATAYSFLLMVYAGYLNKANKKIDCGGGVFASSRRLKQVAKSQVDYILGNNPLNMSYMVGYGSNFPKRIHHRASSLPSIDQYPNQIDCKGGSSYFETQNPNPNLLLGAIVGGPNFNDEYVDSRADFVHSEPTTYINAPLVGVLAYFKSHQY